MGNAVTAGLCVVGGCHTNVVALEHIVSDPLGKSFGYALTFWQFLAVAVVSALEQVRLRPTFPFVALPTRRLPGRSLITCVVLFAATSIINNYVFKFRISVPVHTVLRSSALLINLVLGYFVFKRRYTWHQLLSGVLVACGVALMTLVTSRDVSDHDRKTTTADDDAAAWLEWCVGVGLLFVTCMLAACLGLVQDKMYTVAKTIGNDTDSVPPWQELMLYNHFLSLFAFTPFLPGIVADTVALPEHLWGWLTVNLLAQLVCIRAVYALTGVSSSFATTMVLTVRKFASLVFSVVMFGHHKTFGAPHYIAMCLVAVGCVAYISLPAMSQSPEKRRTDAATTHDRVKKD